MKKQIVTVQLYLTLLALKAREIITDDMSYQDKINQKTPYKNGDYQKTPYKNGDYVYDTKFDETFEYGRADYVVCANEPERFRKATQDEIDNLNSM